MAVLFDSHLHLDFYKKEEIADIIKRGRDAEVKYMVSIGLIEDLEEILPYSLEISKKERNIWTSIGIHPHDAKLLKKDPKIIDRLKEIALENKERVVAWGEIGLDYHYNYSEPKIQREAFIRQLETALEIGLPIIIHTREAEEDTLSILKEFRPSRVVIHCFTGDIKFAEKILELDYYISFSGIVTFKKSNLKEVVKFVPIQRILIETDAPFLTPHPFRGKRNEPAYLVYTAKKIAEIKGLSFEEIAQITTNNTIEFYNLNSIINL